MDVADVKYRTTIRGTIIPRICVGHRRVFTIRDKKCGNRGSAEVIQRKPGKNYRGDFLAGKITDALEQYANVIIQLFKTDINDSKSKEWAPIAH